MADEPNPPRVGDLYPPGEGPRCLVEGCANEAQWVAGFMHEYSGTCESHTRADVSVFDNVQ